MEQDTHLLVVDDVEQNLVAMDALLARPGVRVLRARSGMEALENLLAHDVAAALFDVHMPGMDGFELAELVRGSQRTRHIPIIFLTAAAADQQRSFRGYDAGAVDFLHKPVEPHVLISKLNVFIEMHRQRRQLAQQMEALQRALQLNEMFTAVLSHDLRTPLSVVKLSSELLLLQGKDEMSRTIGQRLKSSSVRMSRMVEQLLDVSRLRSGGLRLKYAPADLGVLCEQIRSEFDLGGASARVQVHEDGDLTGHFDVDRVLQVLANLIGNALDHGDDRGMVQVHLDGTQPDVLKICVRNKGTIPAAVMARLFEPYHRGEGGEPRGLGLGLYIVERFVAAHGGQAVAHSSAEHGTSIEVTLPRQGAGVPSDAPPALQMTPPAGAPQTSRDCDWPGPAPRSGMQAPRQQPDAR
ncbi:hybrid sensor histidine kinase/response regulator [Schlegelella sp. S2-27]|uniref:histidine kinase n=1 Tax=Caldimonas mangrovi TaxID=2944811 RepID=A0ABT0YUY8_9BURK|nr:hybrid sensor histidine kinase/response regulator [Caldimonas mangrovi]MCM5682565.1 hybrid sensor histidine kinase/response regulator [Caldimonas mangrovi]